MYDCAWEGAIQLRDLAPTLPVISFTGLGDTLEGATARLVRKIGRQITGDYALIGHSLGSVIIRNALGQLRDLLEICDLHIEDENRFVHPALELRRDRSGQRRTIAARRWPPHEFPGGLG